MQKTLHQQNIDSLTEKEVLSDNADLFKVLGKIEGKLHLDVDSNSHCDASRRLPIAVKGKLREELDQHQGIGILTKKKEQADSVGLWSGRCHETER